MSKIRITQIKSTIDKPARQKKTVSALGLNKLNSSIVHELTPQIKGMVEKVSHLLLIENL